MSRKIINCPHCGKILSEDLWKEKPLRQETIKCPHCGSESVFKNGIRYTASREIQRYLCRNCCRRFSNK